MRDISIVYAVGEFSSNTSDHFNDCAKRFQTANWFFEFLMVSLEGVEYHQKAEEEAETKEDMICSLRYRNKREKLCDFSPPLVFLWT